MEYLKIIDERFNSAVTNKGQGIYKIYSLDDFGKPIPINRVLATDMAGVLYIGTTPKRTLQKRLSDFRKCVLPQYKSSPHTAGRRYCKIPALMDRFPYSTLAITFETIDDTSELLTRERKLIDSYVQVFGEAPPLNSY